jgi:hypothetical protein
MRQAAAARKIPICGCGMRGADQPDARDWAPRGLTRSNLSSASPYHGDMLGFSRCGFAVDQPAPGAMLTPGAQNAVNASAGTVPEIDGPKLGDRTPLDMLMTLQGIYEKSLGTLAKP